MFIAQTVDCCAETAEVFSTDCSAAVFGYTRNHKLPVEEGEEAA